MGMRVAKEIYDSNNNWEKTTYYVRDPQGNVMGIYEKTTDQQTQNLSYKIVERNIYGSSMVGLVKSEIELISASAPSATSFIHEIGEKQYYMANHLQSVSAVVSDMVIPKDCNNDNVVDFYRAQIISAVDFYSFGFAQAGRSFNSNDVRVGHNGKEKDDVMNVEGGSYDFGARMYDSRLGRFHSIDPAAKDLPYFSCYQFTNNSPALFIDPTGEKLVVAGTRGYRKSVQSQLRQLTDDKVRVRRNGEVVIKSRNPSPEKKVGTQLVRDIVDNTHTTTVQMSLEVGKNTTAPDDFDASTNGTGCNATVSFDPINLENVDMADGSSTPTPAFIALGHELSHARNIMQGDASGVKRKNPDGSVKIENGEPVINTTVEEIDAILTENKLRKENGIPERFLPLQRYEPIVTTIQKVEVVEPTLPAPPPKTPNNQNK
jgi:RHS repeat-associated protein